MPPITPEEVLGAINLGTLAIKSIENEIAALKAKSGLSDDQILDKSLTRDANEHANAKAFLTRIGQA